MFGCMNVDSVVIFKEKILYWSWVRCNECWFFKEIIM